MSSNWICLRMLLVSKSNDRYLQLEGRLQATEANQADKVEKSLVKNLVIGYVVAPNQNDKHQILKLISAVLTMDQNECTKVGLNKSGGGWFNSILGSGAAGIFNYNSIKFQTIFQPTDHPQPPTTTRKASPRHSSNSWKRNRPRDHRTPLDRACSTSWPTNRRRRQHTLPVRPRQHKHSLQHRHQQQTKSQ